MTKDEKITKNVPATQVGEEVAKNFSAYSREFVTPKGLKQYKDYRNGKKINLTVKDPFYQLIGLFEFDNAFHLSHLVGESFRSFITDLTAQLQKEFSCQTVSEKSLAHTTALCFVRMLEIQDKYTNELNQSSYTDLRLKRIQILGKDFDRAHRQYISSIQALKLMRQIPMNVTVKTVHANIGQNQVIQESTNVNPE